MIETKFSDILHYIHQQTKSKACYILVVNNSVNVLDYKGDIPFSSKSVIGFNQTFLGNQNIKSIEEQGPTQVLKSSFELARIKVISLHKSENSEYFLILLLTREAAAETVYCDERLLGTLSSLVGYHSERVEGKVEFKYKSLIETAIDFIFSLNGFGYIVEVNKNGANALGYTVEEMKGKHFLDFIDDKKRVELSEVFTNTLKSKTTTHFEIDFLHKLKKPITYEFLAAPIIENETIEGMVGIGRDISRRKKNEEKIKVLNEKLIQANKLVYLERDRAKKQITVLEELNLLKNEFISNVSHELRTPLASIVGFAETLSSNDSLTLENVKEFSDIIFSEGKRLAKFIDDILDFSKLDDSKNMNKEKSSLVNIINRSMEEIAPLLKEKGISLISEIPDAEISIFADKEKLSKALLTIFENAIHYTEQNGRITIFVQDFLKEVELFISDTGIGIPEKELKLFFDKFHSTGSSVTKAPITGASLSLAKQIIEFHDGVLQIKSIVGEGTTMIVHLPKTIN